MIVLLLSLRNWVRGSGSCSGSQSATGSRWIFSKRLGGLPPAPRLGSGLLIILREHNPTPLKMQRLLHAPFGFSTGAALMMSPFRAAAPAANSPAAPSARRQ